MKWHGRCKDKLLKEKLEQKKGYKTAGFEGKALLLKTELGDLITGIDDEYLTKEGWKKVTELKAEDSIAINYINDEITEKEKCKGRVAQRI